MCSRENKKFHAYRAKKEEEREKRRPTGDPQEQIIASFFFLFNQISMARRIPSSEANTFFIHPSLLLPLIAAWAAASIAIFFTLCISHHRKSSRPKPQTQSSPSPASNNSVEKTKPEAETIEMSPPSFHLEEPERSSPTTPVEATELVVADVATHGPIGPSVPTSTSRRRLSMSLSMKLPDKLSKIKINRKERREQSEDSIWMKTIILGEKCKVPSDDDDDDDDEAATVVDDNGNRRRSYRPRTPKSLPISRSNSYVGAEQGHS